MALMRLYRLKPAGDRIEPVLLEDSLPEPGPNEVRVRIEAASLNYRDLIIQDGGIRNGVDGRIPLSDGAGRVDASGPGAEKWNVGDRVATSFFRDWRTGPFRSGYLGSALGGSVTDGVLAEYIVLPETALVSAPSELSAIETATLPCAAVTAWQALMIRSELSPEDSLLVHGTGGVALFGVQFAKAVGATVVVISSSDLKLERVRELGADIGINYRTIPEWHEAVLERTNGKGVTRILELGGSKTYQRSINSLADGGKIAQIGNLSGFDLSPTLNRLQGLNGDILGITVGSREHFEGMNAFIQAHRIAPVIDRTFAFDEVPAAYEHLRSGSHFGKIAIRL